MPGFANLYEVLGVRRSATQDDLKRAYHKASRENHPDKNPGIPQAAGRMQAINAAWEVLRDPQKRATYNASLGSEGPINELSPEEEAATQQDRNLIAWLSAKRAELREQAAKLHDQQCEHRQARTDGVVNPVHWAKKMDKLKAAMKKCWEENDACKREQAISEAIVKAIVEKMRGGSNSHSSHAQAQRQRDPQDEPEPDSHSQRLTRGSGHIMIDLKICTERVNHLHQEVSAATGKLQDQMDAVAAARRALEAADNKHPPVDSDKARELRHQIGELKCEMQEYEAELLRADDNQARLSWARAERQRIRLQIEWDQHHGGMESQELLGCLPVLQGTIDNCKQQWFPQKTEAQHLATRMDRQKRLRQARQALQAENVKLWEEVQKSWAKKEAETAEQMAELEADMATIQARLDKARFNNEATTALIAAAKERAADDLQTPNKPKRKHVLHLNDEPELFGRARKRQKTRHDRFATAPLLRKRKLSDDAPLPEPKRVKVANFDKKEIATWDSRRPDLEIHTSPSGSSAPFAVFLQLNATERAGVSAPVTPPGSPSSAAGPRAPTPAPPSPTLALALELSAARRAKEADDAIRAAQSAAEVSIVRANYAASRGSSRRHGVNRRRLPRNKSSYPRMFPDQASAVAAGWRKGPNGWSKVESAGIYKPRQLRSGRSNGVDVPYSPGPALPRLLLPFGSLGLSPPPTPPPPPSHAFFDAEIAKLRLRESMRALVDRDSPQSPNATASCPLSSSD